MQLICLVNMRGLFLWKIKKSTSIVNAFKKTISEGHKPNEIWVDQGSEFYSKSFTDFLKLKNIDMYWTFNEGKSVIAEIFIRTLRIKYTSTWQLFQKMFIMMH